MSTTATPLIRTLNRAECDAVPARNHVGRVAYARGNRIDIQPVHFAFHQAWIYGRTRRGAMLDTTGDTWWPVALEVDEAEAPFRWRSVVVHGGFYTIPPDGVAGRQAEWKEAVGLLRTLLPGTFTADDPVAFRQVLFRIAVQDVSGREAVAGGAAG